VQTAGRQLGGDLGKLWLGDLGKPSQIARRFGLSQSEVRKALASGSG
jgi:hypothetical protein